MTVRVGVWLVQALARLTLSADFRRRYGVELLELTREGLEAEARRGWIWGWAAVVRASWDVVEQGRRERAHMKEEQDFKGWGEGMMDTIEQDVRFALRSLLKAPGFVAIAVLTLALGIGANTAIFSLVNAVLLRAPAHVDQPGELITIYTSDFSGGPGYGMNSRPDYEDFRSQVPAIDDAVALSPGVVNVAREDGLAEIFVVEAVSGNYFDVLGVEPAYGRTFSVDEGDYTSGAAVAVLSHGLWSRAFAADPGVVGTTFRASGQTVTIVGIAPEGFAGSVPLITPELWIPPPTDALINGVQAYEGRGARGSIIRARLADGATAAQAQEQLTALARRLHETWPSNWTDVNDEIRRVTVVEDALLPPTILGPLKLFAGLLLGVVGVVLLIACANVANLTLARATRRGKEMAIRISMGAGRGRIVRQLLSESLIIGAAGGLGGAALATWALRFAETFRPVTGVAVSLDLGVDGRVFAFSAVVTVLTVMAVGLLPALRASRPDVVPQLKENAAEGSGPFRWHELRHLLVVSQVSASLLLLVGAGLFLKSLRAAVDVDPGFAVEGLAAMSLGLGPEGFDTDEAMNFMGEIEERISSAPSVASTALVDAMPMTLMAGRRSGITVPGYEAATGEDMEFQFHSVGPGYMETMGTEVLRGREFTAEDHAEAQFTILVNESFAEHFWPTEDPLGQIVVWAGSNEAQVVGVVADAMYRDLRDEGRLAFFLPLAQNPSTSLTLLARTRPGGTPEVLGAMRREVTSRNANLPISSLQSMEDAIAFTLLPQRIAGSLLTIAGALGLLLATVGLYGVMSFLVSQRTREVAVRMALGAERADVIRMVVRRGLLLASIGAVLGLGVAAAVTRFASSLLFGVSTLDVTVFAAMAIAALAVSALASWVPARRAATIAPMEALREE